MKLYGKPVISLTRENQSSTSIAGLGSSTPPACSWRSLVPLLARPGCFCGVRGSRDQVHFIVGRLRLPRKCKFTTDQLSFWICTALRSIRQHARCADEAYQLLTGRISYQLLTSYFYYWYGTNAFGHQQIWFNSNIYFLQIESHLCL